MNMRDLGWKSRRGLQRASLAILTTAVIVSFLPGATAQAVSNDDGGTFVPITPSRAGTDVIPAEGVVTYQISGLNGVPATGVSAVAVTLSATSTDTLASSYLTAYPSTSTRPAVSTLSYTKETAPRSTTAIIQVGTSGKISVFNKYGNTRAYLDVQGYFTTTSTAASTGGFVPVTPTRIARSDTGEGMTAGAVAVGSNRDIQVTGLADVPSSATSVYANIIVADGAAAGAINAGPGGADLTGGPAALRYGDSGVYSGAVAVALSSAGKIRLRNTVGSAINIRVDVQGYFTGDPNQGASFHSLKQGIVYSTTGSTVAPLAGGETREVPVGGFGGLPADDSMSAIALIVLTKNWTSGGSVTVWNSDLETKPIPPTSNFIGTSGSPSAGVSTSSIVQASSAGTVKITNTSADPVDIQITTNGYFNVPTNGLSSPEPQPTSGEVVVVGKVLNGTAPVANQTVMIEAWPTISYQANLAEEDVVPQWKIGNVLTQSDGSFTKSFLTTDVPSQFRTADGEIDLSIYATDSTVSLNYTQTVRPVTNASGATTSNVLTAAFNLATNSAAPPAADVVMNLGTGETTDLSDASEYDDESGPPVTEQVGFFAPISKGGPGLTGLVELPTSEPAPLPAGVFANSDDFDELLSEPLASQHQRTLSLINQQSGGTLAAATPNPTDSTEGATLNASYQTPVQPVDDSFCTLRKKELKTNQRERFGSVYNWSGAKVDWYQTSKSKHKLGVATKIEKGGWKVGGSKTVTKEVSASGTVRGVVNKTYSNRVNYRRYANGCTGEQWYKAENFAAFFTDPVASTAQTWNKGCIAYDNFDFVKDRLKAYTKEGGVSLSGIINLDAQAGYDSGTRFTIKVRKKSWICGNSSTGINNARGVLAKKR